MNWEMLPDDVWSLIGSKLDVAADRVRFRAVCKAWMSMLPLPPSIWLMIPQTLHLNEEEQEQMAGPGFVIAGGEEHIYHFDLPEDYHSRRCVGSTGTSLITVDLDGKIRVFNLFSRVEETSLPPQSTFVEITKMPQGTTPEQARDSFIGKIVLSSPDFSDRNCVALAIHHRLNKIAIARPGDASWILLDSFHAEVYYLEDIIFLNEKFFCIGSHGLVMVLSIGNTLDACEIEYFTREELEPNPETYYRPKKYYLVDWMGELVLVVRRMVYPPFSEVEADINHPVVYSTHSFQLYKLNLQNTHLYQDNWVELNSLGEYSLFLGLNTSVSLRVSDYNRSLKRNCIYFTDDFAYSCCMQWHDRRMRRGLDMGVYDLESNTFQPCYRDIVFPTRAAPVWVVPTPPSAVCATEEGSSTTA